MTFTPYPAEADSDRAPRSTLGERLWGTAVVVAVGLGVLVVTWESAGYGMGPWLLGTSWFWWGLALWVLVGGVGAVALGKVWGHWNEFDHAARWAEASWGNDMFGAACIDPTDLGEGWWMCGM